MIYDLEMPECPCCGNYLTVRKWHDDNMLVEYNEKCSCGYEHGWSYGMSYTNYPDGYNDDGDKIGD